MSSPLSSLFAYPVSRVTQKDVAKEANVSQRLVSQVLGKSQGTARASAATRQRIQEAAKRLGYQVHLSARSMRLQRFHTIGYMLFIESWGVFLPPRVLASLNIELQRNNYQALYMQAVVTETSGKRLAEYIAKSHIDAGIILDPSHHSPRFQDMIDECSKPFVYFNLERDRNAVLVDEYHSVDLAMTHLFDLGHERIAYLHNPPPPGHVPHYSSRIRKEQYTLRMADRGLKPSFVCGDRIEEIVSQLRAGKELPTAIYCYDDRYALMLFYACSQLGISVPKELSIIAHGDDTHASLTPIGLTTLVMPWEQMSRRAAQIAIELSERSQGNSKADFPSVCFTPELSLRESTAPCSKP